MNRTYPILLLFFLVILWYGCSDQEGGIIPSDGKSGYSLSESALDGGASGTAMPGSGDGSGDSTQQHEPGVITAAEWNDLENWDFWYNLMEEDTFGYASEYWAMYPLHNRYSLIVKNPSGQPAIDVPVALMSGGSELWKAHTDNKGKAEFWVDVFSGANAQSYSKLKFYINGNPVNQAVVPFDQGINTIIYSSEIRPETLDLAFVVDATGSMADELEYLKTEVLDVIQQVKSSNSQLKVKMGSVFYRDEGDDYVTKVSNLTTNIQTTVDFINAQSANGGGDYPEAVHSAMKDAVEQLSWSDKAVSRIVFLLLDAPPHYDQKVIDDVKKEIENAAKKGIKVIPVSASGIDKGTEFLLRFMSVISNGTYVFITNDSGIGNDHLTPTVGDYEVEYLNELMVRLINRYVE